MYNTSKNEEYAKFHGYRAIVGLLGLRLLQYHDLVGPTFSLVVISWV